MSSLTRIAAPFDWQRYRLLYSVAVVGQGFFGAPSSMRGLYICFLLLEREYRSREKCSAVWDFANGHVTC
jgi:hypothetical protein